MITAFFFLLLFYAIAGIVSPLYALPDVSLSANVLSALTTAGGYISILDVAIPVSTIIAVFFAFIGLEGGLFIYKTIKWGYTKLPGIN